jgi:hypothetical protein
MPNILQLMLRPGSHTTAQYSMEYRHDIHELHNHRPGFKNHRGLRTTH